MSDKGVISSSDKKRGIAISLGSQTLWGMAGNVAQYLFVATAITVEWLVSFRLILAGIILLVFWGVTHGFKDLMAIWKSKQSAFMLILFSVFGMLGIQLTYFMTINYSNAATATVLQFTSPVLIIGYLALRNRKLPNRVDAITVVVAVIGTFLLITEGHLNTLSISMTALIWGFLTAVTDSIYILLPKKLLIKYGAVPVVAWSFLIGGLVMNVVHPIWVGLPAFTWTIFWALVFMVIPATTFAYLMELQSVPLLKPEMVAILQSVEPITSTLIAVIFMGVTFNWVGSLGIILVIATVFIQALASRTNKMK
jgi:Predicted permease, DMT superfamily